MTSYVPPSLARALAGVTFGGDGVHEGVHWHVDLSPALGLPLHPFLLWPLAGQPPGRPEAIWTDPNGEKLGFPIDLSAGPVVAELLAGDATPPLLWVWVKVEVVGGPALVEVLDRRLSPAGEDRVVAATSGEPYALGAPGITRLRVSGEGQLHGLMALEAESIDIGSPAAVQNVGLPVDDLWWYTHGPASSGDAWRDRVDCSVTGLPPMDPIPAGGGAAPLEPQAELRRVDPQPELRRVDAVRSEPERWLRELLSDSGAGGPKQPAHTAPARAQHLDSRQVWYRPLDALLSAATADPGLARWLGTTDRLRDPEPPPEPGPYLVLAASTWAVPTHRVAFEGIRDAATLGDLLAGTQTPGNVLERVRAELGDDWNSIEETVGTLRRALPDLGWETRTLLLVAAAEGERVVDLPPAPDAQALADGAWLPPELDADGRLLPRDAWRQEISLVRASPNGPVALLRERPDGPVSAHRQVEVQGVPRCRSVAMLAGYPTGAATPPNLAGAGLGGPGARPAGIERDFLGHVLPGVLTPRDPVVVDGAIPAHPDGASWSVSEGDWMGRWGKATPVPAKLPPRPRPATPTVSGLLVRGETPHGEGAASAGVLRITVGLPAVSAPGGLPLAAVRLSTDAGASWLELPTPAGNAGGNATPTVRHDLPAPLTTPARGIDVEITAVAVAEDGSISEPPTSCVIEVRDARPAPVPNTARRLVVAGRRDPEGLSEVVLRWTASHGASGYRVYLGVQDRLLRAIDLGEELTRELLSGPRAALADAVCERESSLRDRALFSLLTHEPLPVPDGGQMRYPTTLPAGLTGVAFLRVVPLTLAGVEASFAACGLTPVVVPLDEAPPAPALAANVEPGGSVRLTIDARGIDPAIVAQLGGGTPEVRLLRPHPSLPDDPAYWPEAAVADLSLRSVGLARWTAEGVVGPEAGFPAWTPLSWAAQVAYPPEPTLPAGAASEPADLRAEWPGPDETPSPWGPVSVPAHAMVTAALPAPTVEFDAAPAGTVQLRVGGLPTAPLDAPAPVRVRIFVAGGDGLAPHGTPIDVLGRETVVPGLPPADLYAVQAIDPLGMPGEPVLIEP